MKKKLLFVTILFLTGSVLVAQYPDPFSYSEYVTDVRDQLVAHPCYVHATIAGIETMYNMYYGENIDLDLSERALFSCSRSSQGHFLEKLGPVINYVEQHGVILEDFKKYPGPAKNCAANSDLFDTIFDTTFDCQANQEKCGVRYFIDALGIPVNNMVFPDTVKKYLISYGPIIFDNPGHAMLLYGWDGTNWIVKDSYECDPSKNRKIPFNGAGAREPVKFSEAFVIKSITKEKYDTITHTWSVVRNLPIKYLNLNHGFLKIVKVYTPSPLCFNRGIKYELKGLDKLVGETVTGWSYTASGDKSLTLSIDGAKCTVSGNASGVTLSALIKRKTGLLDTVSLYIGNVGVPNNLSTFNGHCAGTNYEINSKMETCYLPGCSYSFSYNIPASSDGSYYVFKSGPIAYWVFKTPNAVRYSATIMATQPGCSPISNTQSAIIFSQWCGTSFKSSNNSDLNDSAEVLEDLVKLNKENLEENSLLVSPNPVTNMLTLSHIGEGTNDICIYDMSGRRVYAVKIEETVTIDVSFIPRGVYFVRYYTDGTVKQDKPIKIILE